MQKFGISAITYRDKKIQNRAIRYFLGVHKNAPILGLQSEMGWLNVKFRLYHYYRVCIGCRSIFEGGVKWG